jgi:WD40 repeat protein
VRDLLRLVVVYRAVMLYGDSGSGKSSLVNAGLMDAARAKGLQPERIRLQPSDDQEFVVERIAVDEESTGYLPSIFAADDNPAQHVVLSGEVFARLVRTGCTPSTRTLLVFDQFEELVTLFETTAERAIQRRIVDVLIELVRSDVAVKVLFVFREDYLARVKQLLAAAPELVDQALRLTPPTPEDLPTIIRGPFERFNFGHELGPELAERLSAKLADRFGSGGVSLTEVQTVCLRLWQSDDPEALLESKGVRGLLEEYLGEELDRYSDEVRYAAVALLSEMVTAEGTRSVVSAEDLISRVREGEKLSPELLEEALERLERDSKLVRCERRRDLYLYEITSEFLVPWISGQRDELVRLKESRKQRRRRLLIGLFASSAALIAIFGSLGVWAIEQSRAAERAEKRASALAMAFSSTRLLSGRLDAALLVGLDGFETSDRTETRSSMISALEAALGSRAVVILRGHAGSVQSVAVTRNGRTIASGGADGTIIFWDARRHKMLGAPLAAGSAVWSVAFSPDGRLLASADNDGTVRLWNVKTRRQLGRSLHAASTVRSVAFSPDGGTLASAGDGGAVELWNARKRARLSRLAPVRRHADPVWSVAFGHDGRLLFAASTETCQPTGFADQDAHASASLFVWSLGTRRRIGDHEDTGDGCAVVVSPDGRTLATAGLARRVQLWDARGRLQQGRRLPAGASAGVIESLAFDSTSRLLASAGYDQAVRVWDVPRHVQLEPPLTGHAGTVNGVAFLPGGRMLVSGGSEGTVRIWSTQPLSRLDFALRGHRGSISALAVDPRTGVVISGGNDGSLRMWDLATRKQLRTPLAPGSGRATRVLEPESVEVDDVAVGSDGRLLVSGGEDGRVRLWNALTGKEMGAPIRAAVRVWAVAISPDERMLASGGPDDTIRLWNVRDHRPMGVLRGHSDAVRDLAFTPDGTLVSASWDKTIRLWDVQTHKQVAVLRGHTGLIFGVAVSPDGRTLASGGDDTVRLWDLRTHAQIGEALRGHSGFVYGVAFSPDGTILASVGIDGTVRLWDVKAHKPLGQPLRGHAGAVYAVAFSRGGNVLVSSGKDGTVRIWRGFLWSNPKALRREVCSLVIGKLTRAEWQDFAPGVKPHASCES